MTKQQQLTILDAKIADAAKKCEAANVDVRPWNSNDHPASLAHWALVQERIHFRREREQTEATAEQRHSQGQRLKTAREARPQSPTPSIPIARNASNPMGDPQPHREGLLPF